VAYIDVLAELERREVRYLVVGGVAVNLHGVPRMTADLDLLIDLERENVLRVVSALAALGYRPRVPVAAEDLADHVKRENWIREKNMLVFSFFHHEKPYELIDLLLASPVSFEEASARTERLSAGGTTVRVASIEDLIRMKSITERGQDRADIEALERLRRLGGQT